MYKPICCLLILSAFLLLGGCGGSSDKERSDAPGPQQTYKWRMVTTWPKNFPGVGTGPENYVKLVDEMSNGRLKIRVFGAGELVPDLEVFDAVSLGTVEMGHGASYYWKGKIPAAQFFTALPFGMTAGQMNAWLHYGGGLQLWEELYAPYGVLPLASGNTGTQMAGWFNREINSVEDLRGLKIRMPGVGGEVLRELGAAVVTLPGREIYTSFQTGVIDATEWVGPYNDLAFGLHQVAKYYYYPGWQEPGPVMEAIVNKQAFGALPKDLQAIVRTAARAINQDMLDEYTARNNAALDDLINKHGIQVRPLPDEVLRELRTISEDIIAAIPGEDPLARRIYDSYRSFHKSVVNYHEVAERAYVNALAETEKDRN